VQAEDRTALVTEMGRVTKPGGRVLIVDFRFGSLRGVKGRALHTASTVIERFSGHYSGYRSFRASGGVPAVVNAAGLATEREKIVAGGNVAIFVVVP